MASPLDLYSFVSGEYDAGRKQRDGNRLKALYQQALSDPSQNQRAIIGQVAGIDPSQAKGLYDLLNSRAEDQRKAVGQRAAMVRALPQEQRQAAYEGIRPDLDAAGLFAPEGADEGYLGAVAQTYGGVSGGQELRPHVIGNALVDASGKVLYQGESPEKWSLVNVPDGQGGTVQMEYSNGQFRTPAYQGSPQPQGITGGGGQVLDDAYRGAQVDPVTDFSTLAQKYPGVQVSSLARSPEHNAKVGGVANSYHVKGQGGDFVVPVAQRPQFMAEARQMGYDAIDEGDHVHLEPRRGVQASSRFAPGQGIGGQRMGYTPPKSDQQKQPARRLTPQEVAEHGLAPGTVAYMGESGVPNVVQRPTTGSGGGAPLPVGALREQLAIEDAIGSSKHLAETLNKHANRMVSGELQVSPMNAIGAKGRTFLGMANQSDSNLTEFKADITRTVNEWLRLNKGVQTEGDAVREFKAIMDSNDPVTVANAVTRLSGIIQNTIEIQQRKREQINRNYGRQQQPQGGGVRRVQSAADYDALPSGAIYIAPDGQQRRKR